MNYPVIKICNVTTREEVDILVKNDVDIAGFRILKSDVKTDRLDRIIDALNYANTQPIKVGLTVNDFDLTTLTKELHEADISYIFLHFDVNQHHLDAIRGQFSKAKIATLLTYEDLSISGDTELGKASDYRILDWSQGGTGVFPSLDLFDNIDSDDLADRCFIAGGLNSENVGFLLDFLVPHGLDLDSSVRDPKTRMIESERVSAFMSAVRNRCAELGQKSNLADLPFANVDQRPWSTITDTLLTDSKVVANSRLLSIIDDNDRYRNVVDSVNQRIFNALNALSQHPDVKRRWLTAALIALSGTLYFPREMLNSTVRYLHTKVLEQLSQRKLDPNGFHVFANDPGALLEDYFRLNEIHGRLDQDKHARIKGVEDLGRSLADLQHRLQSQRQTSSQQLKMVLNRQVWVMLVDQSLSGHSLIGDLEKILWLLGIRKDTRDDKSVIIVLCQVLTSTALRALKKVPEIKEAINGEELIIESAIFLDDSYSIVCPPSIQVQDPRVLGDLHELCEWFSLEYIREDARLSRMRRKSHDDLQFGYRKAGLLIARQENCPTDSLPILWYDGVGRQGFHYKGPFPRVHSRIDEQKVENTADLWEQLQESDEIHAEIKSLINTVPSDD